MSSPLSQDLAGKIIEVLTQRGHVLLSRGGKPALVRELADRMNDTLATIIGRMPPPGIVDNEVTSTFGDEAVDDTVEEMVEDITASLMDSDQVEDIFSEDAVIRRDVFRVVKDTLLAADRPWADAEEADVEVALGTLGYVASKAAQLAAPDMVESALERAAKASGARLLKVSPETQSATFRAALATPDARLELEEAVADELSSLVDDGKVLLPTIERTLPIGRSAASDERRAARTRIDVAASRTLLRSGCTATWEFVGDDTISVSLVPMSDQDGRTVDTHVEAFAREIALIFGAARTTPAPDTRPAPRRDAAPTPAAGIDAWLRLAREVAEPPPASKKPTKAQPVSERLPPEKPAAKKPAPAIEKPATKKPAPAIEKPATKKPAPAIEKPAAKKPAPAIEKPAAKKPAPIEKPATKKPAPAIEKPATKKPAPIEKPATKKPAAKPAAKKPAAKPAAKKPAAKAKPAPAKKPAAKKPAPKRR